VGDFNFPEIDWNTCHIPNSIGGRLFFNTVRKLLLSQHIDFPTRGRGTDTPHVLDLVLTDRPLVNTIERMAPIGKSDHCVILIKTNIGVEQEVRKQKLNFAKGDYDSFRLYMTNKLTEQERPDDDVDSAWEKLKLLIENGVNAYVPMIKIFQADTGGKQRNPLPESVRKQIKKKNRLWKKYIAGVVEEEVYKKQRNKVKTAVRRHARKQQNNVALEVKTNPKKFWSYVNAKTKVRDKIGELRTCGKDGQQTEAVTDQEKADALNCFFASVFTCEPDGPFEEMTYNKGIKYPMDDIEITVEEVKEKLDKLKVNKSPGPDMLHPRVLYELREEIVYPLVKIFNLSIKSKEIPSDWRNANITAIYKKGKKSDVGNYRPISLTCIVCKVMEAIIRDKITKHFTDNQIFTDRQFGFLKGRSTVTQLLRILDHWTDLLGTGGKVDVIYTDLEKAFDKVSHRRLLSKLRSYGLHTNVVDRVG